MFPSPKSHDVTYVYTFMWNISIQFPHISQMNMNQMKVTTLRYYKILRMQRHPPSSWLTSPFFLQFSSLNPQDPCDAVDICRHSFSASLLAFFEASSSTAGGSLRFLSCGGSMDFWCTTWEKLNTAIFLPLEIWICRFAMLCLSIPHFCGHFWIFHWIQ